MTGCQHGTWNYVRPKYLTISTRKVNTNYKESLNYMISVQYFQIYKATLKTANTGLEDSKENLLVYQQLI